MGRACSDGETNPTQEIIAMAQQDGIDIAAGRFIIGPELPDISSSRARIALRAGDLAALRGMLHPRVLEWNLTAGTYNLLQNHRPVEGPNAAASAPQLRFVPADGEHTRT